MAVSLAEKLVIAVSANALLDFREADRIFKERGLEAYKEYQVEHENEVIAPGPAFPFIKRLLAVNRPGEFEPVEVVLLSRNSPDAGLRAMNSIKHHRLPITRAIFTGGGPRYKYIPVLNASLFLSTNEEEVREAIAKDCAAGLILEGSFADEDSDDELRIAFDFDGILGDDSAEAVYKKHGLQAFYQHEDEKAGEPLPPGPLKPLLEKIAQIKAEDARRYSGQVGYRPRIRTAIFTARNAPAHARAIKTLRSWGIQVDEAAFLGGVDKVGFLRAFRPHIFFDDQMVWAKPAASHVPSAHIPFGVANRPTDAGKAGASLKT